MKRARARDHWRHVESNSPHLTIDRIQVRRSLPFGDIDFKPGGKSLVAICGHNGCGKTTFLRLIAACLGENPSGPWDPAALIEDDGGIEIEGRFRGKGISLQYPTPNDESIVQFEAAEDVYYLEPSFHVPYLQRTLHKTSDIRDLANVFDSGTIPKEDVGYILGRDYEEIDAYEIEIRAEEVVPYFVVNRSGVSYDSRQMGLGELSAFWICWSLERLRKGSVVLLEEPEVFVSPRSQRAIIDIVAKYIDKKSLAVVISSHSPHLLDPIPKNCKFVFSQDSGQSKLIPTGEFDEELAILGIVPPLLGICHVEDLAAQTLLEAILRRYKPAALERLCIVMCGGDCEVVVAANRLSPKQSPFVHLIILDGDKREEKHQSKWPILFLPTADPPEALIFDIDEDGIRFICSRLGIDEPSLRKALTALGGVDLHDKASALGDRFGLSQESVLLALSNNLLEKGSISKVAEDLAHKIAEEL